MARVARIAGTASDSEVAAELGASPQSLYAWKLRGTVPFERVCQFALRRNVSLDWLLLGKGKPGAIGGPINNDLFSLVFNQLHAALDQMALDNFPWPHFVANVAAIYNEALLREVEGASASALVTALVCRRVGDLAGAMASTMKSRRL